MPPIPPNTGAVLRGTVDFAILHEISSHNTIFNNIRITARSRRDILDKGFALFDVLTEIKADDTKCDFFGYTKLLNNLELHGAFGKVVVTVYRYANAGDRSNKAVVDPVIGDWALLSATTVLRGHGMRNVPFDE
ncbi:hypothetical protein HG531_005184 [Fusarium graminearum]|nr:hypothetical protein HG531_005184 [Fusarium graminearum]